MRRGRGAVVIALLLLRVEGGSGGYANPCRGYGYECGSARPYPYPYPRDTRHVTRVGYPYPWYTLPTGYGFSPGKGTGTAPDTQVLRFLFFPMSFSSSQ